ncbi:insulinase family protein [Hyphomicrobium sp. LHD-15]|uniref:M16 family metallopeptidase n=1 Tax=Hyphomicrobium sp. LHD-15 TaxID=3072142 RepID=UPI00280F1315|nr:insulinase family protein [Hyphomicrobium sp. LHD-15]MDQ8700623.1 insulinase family protein [Hyphomicrobium sp. LHD-15]
MSAVAPRYCLAHGTLPSPGAIRLSNGFRVHCLSNDTGYVLATLVLRSESIVHDGLAHLCEHTSCSGAAGGMSSADVVRMFKDYVQVSNASTEQGALKWHASFLPKYLPQVIELLAAVSLGQTFDTETVTAQSRVVLQELYLEKYDPVTVAQGKFDRELFGKSHPYARDTVDAEIAKSKTPIPKLVEELRTFAAALRLPANMDLFLVGSVELGDVERLVQTHFGKYAFAQGPLLQLPQVAVTKSYKGLTEKSFELAGPMTDVKIAWNTGACVASNEARVLLALSEYLYTALFDDLREKDGDSYTPEVSFDPDSCSGIFRIGIASSKDPKKLEKRVFEVVDRLKSDIDDRELARIRDRVELKRRTESRDNQALLARLMDRTLYGASVDDLAVETVTRDEMLDAARRYLPSHRNAYVRLALKGQ